MSHRGFGHAYTRRDDDDDESSSTYDESYNNNNNDTEDETRRKNRQLTAGDTGSKFAALKKDFLFHEKRMQLLLSSSVVEGLNAAITEKLTTRDECADDCKKTLKQLSDISQMPTLTGRWNESVVASVLQLNIPLRDVVGSQLFESTASGEVEDLKDIIKKLAEQAEEHAEFQQQNNKSKRRGDEFADDDDNVDDLSAAVDNALNNSASSINQSQRKVPPSVLVPSLLGSIEPQALSSRDVRRMKDAVFSKLQVISELSHLSDALQKSGFQLAQVRSEVCHLQEQEDSANNDGEVAVSETLVEQRIQNLEKIIDIIFFRLHTVDATIDTNVTKRHSNLQALQHTTVALEGIKREKDDVVNNCAEDIRRIDRSLQLQQVKDQTDSHGAELLAESKHKLESIENKRTALSDRLKSLGAEFLETERALAKLGVERAMAIDRHLDLVEQSRHAASDFAEMSRFATAHRKNLEITREKASEGFEAVELLERLLLQETDYMKYNFRASAQRLQNVRENVAGELKSALRDYEIAIGEMLRRKQEIVLKLEEQIHVAQCEAELRKDIFDPMAKKFVEKQRKLEDQRNVLVQEMCILSEKLGQQVSSIKNRLGEEFVNDRVSFSDNNNAMMNNNGSNTTTANNNTNNNNKKKTNSLGAQMNSSSSINGAKQMVSNLREKIVEEMSMLQLEQARNDEASRASLDATQRHLRDVVDGVSRLTEDEELHRRNLRKHERFLDQRQELLDVNNLQVSAIEERKELAAFAQTVDNTHGQHHQNVVNEYRRREEEEENIRRGLLLHSSSSSAKKTKSIYRSGNNDNDDDDDADDTTTAVDSRFGVRSPGRGSSMMSSSTTPQPKPFRQQQQNTQQQQQSRPASSGALLSSNARALSIRDEIRRLKAQASSLASKRGIISDGGGNSSSGQDHHHHESPSPASASNTTASMMMMNRNLEQVLVSNNDANNNSINNNTTVQGSGVRAAKSRAHPRVIGSNYQLE